MKFADADATFAKGKVELAERMYDKMLRTHSKSSPEVVAVWKLRYADCLLRLGRADAAEAACRDPQSTAQNGVCARAAGRRAAPDG